MSGREDAADAETRLAAAVVLEENAEEWYEHAPVGYLSTLPDGTIVRANETLLAWTRHGRADLVGRKRLHDLLAPGDRIYYETHYAPLLQMQGSVREIAVELVRADGSRLPVLMNSTLVSDDRGRSQIVRTTLFDASERRRYERELLRARADAEARARASLALAHVADGVVLTTAEGDVELLNAAAETIFGVETAAVAGRPAVDVVPGWAGVVEAAAVGTLRRPAQRTTVPVVVGGRETWLSAVGVDAGDGVVYTIRDVTADHALDRLRNDLVAIVSHELRTPLTGAYGAAQTLSTRYDDLGDADRRMLLQMIVEQCHRLARIVDQILLTSRLDYDNIATSVETFDAGAVVDTVVEGVPPGDRARVIVDATAAGRVRGDLDRLRQVVANVVENALKYSDGSVRVAARSDGDHVRFTVGDDGAGIPPAERGRVFEKFYRLDPDQRSGVSGTGLGLYIARELVTRMGGRIGFLPQERGTTVYVDIPRAD